MRMGGVQAFLLFVQFSLFGLRHNHIIIQRSSDTDLSKVLFMRLFMYNRRAVLLRVGTGSLYTEISMATWWILNRFTLTSPQHIWVLDQFIVACTVLLVVRIQTIVHRNSPIGPLVNTWSVSSSISILLSWLLS